MRVRGKTYGNGKDRRKSHIPRTARKGLQPCVPFFLFPKTSVILIKKRYLCTPNRYY